MDRSAHGFVTEGLDGRKSAAFWFGDTWYALRKLLNC